MLKTNRSNSQQSSPLNEQDIDQTSTLQIYNFSTTNPKETFHQFHQPSQSHKSQICLFIVITFLAIALAYLLIDNYKKQQQIVSIVEKISMEKKQNQLENSIERIERTIKIDANGIDSIQRSSKIDIFANSALRIQYKQLQLKQYPNGQIPKRAWYFSDKLINESTLWTQKCFQAYQKRVHDMGDYEFIAFDISEYSKYIPSERYQFVQQEIRHLNLRYKQGDEPQIIRYRDYIIRQLIVLEVLIENGGIYLDQDIILTQDLQWLNSIHQNTYVNAKQWINKAQVIAFHSIKLSPEIQKQSIINSTIQTQKYITLSPSISPYFLAAIKNCRFLRDVRVEYYELLAKNRNIYKQIQGKKLPIDFQQRDPHIYKHLFQIASQIVINDKNIEKPSQKMPAIKFYQIATISQNYGPKKIQVFLNDGQINKIYRHLSKITLEELQYEFGRIRYMAKMDPKEDFQDLLLESVNTKSILANSLIHSTLFQSQTLPFITTIPEQQQIPNKLWQKLPKIIWTYQTQANLFQSNLLHKIWLQHIKVTSKASSYELRILNQANLQQYISKQIITSIQSAILNKNRLLSISIQSKIQMLRLAILYEHGGVWLKPQTFITQGLQWLQHINQEPFIWNRYGDNPQVLMAFHPHYAPFEWKYNSKGVKQAWQLGYQINFIASQPKAELLKDWLQEHMANLKTTFDQLTNKFYVNKMGFNRWITDRNHQQLILDSINSVLGAKKLKFINDEKDASPNQYYGLWAINGFASYLKLRQHTNFISPRQMQNPYIWRSKLSQFQDLAGKFHYFVTIYPSAGSKIQLLCFQNIKNLQRQINRESYVMKLLDEINQTIIFKRQSIYLSGELQQVNSKMEAEQLVSSTRILWIYTQAEDEKDTLVQKIYERAQQYATKSQFDTRIVDKTNFAMWLSSQTHKDVSQFIENLQRKLKKDSSNLKDHFEDIIQQYITLNLLYQNGGVAITKKIVLLQNFTWIGNLETEQFVNKEGATKPKVFAFYSPGYSPKLSDNKNNESFLEFPSLQSYFLAAGKNTLFLQDLLQQYKRVIFSHDKVIEEVKSLGHPTGFLNGHDPNYEALFLASQFVITKKHKQLVAGRINMTAIDFYGLYTMNSRYFVSKMSNFFTILKTSQKQLLSTLSQSSMNELQSYVGNLRYICSLPMADSIKVFIERHQKQQKGYQIAQDSFIHKYLIDKTNAKGIVRYEKASLNNKNKWESLPAEVWIVPDPNLQQTSLITEVMIYNLNAAYSKGRFKIRFVNQKNVRQYLTQDELSKIKPFIEQKRNQAHKYYLYKLLLLQKYGGIAITTNFLITEDVNWIRDISSFDPQVIFNRYADRPKVLMFASQLTSPNNEWAYSNTYKTKVGHIIGWKDGFIAAEKNSSLIKEWVQNFISLLSKNEEGQLKQLYQCNIKQARLSKTSLSLLRLDSLYCTLNRKQKELSKQNGLKSPSLQYQLWGVSEFVGPAKLQDQISVDRIESNLNPFLWKWSEDQVERIIGKLRFMTSLSNNQLSLLQQLINKRQLKPWGEDNSLLTRSLYSVAKQKLRVEDGRMKFIE